MLIMVVGALLVFGGYYVWMGFLDFMEDSGNITAPVTRQAFATATAASRPIFPTAFVPPATYTALPPCITFRVNVERAVYRECPSQDNRECPIRDVAPYGTEFCVYARAPGNPEWYIVELNPGGAYRDTVYMHESVIEPVNPTPTPSMTFTPLPTISPTPSFTPSPTVITTPTDTPDQTISPSPAPTLPASETPAKITI